MSAARVLRPAQIKRLAELLDSPTGRELHTELERLRLPMGTESTEWRMLRESFTLAQERDGQANSILQFVSAALDPAHELGSGDLSSLRASINEVLALSGVQVRPDGKLIEVTQSATASDARARADRLRERLRERAVHPDVRRFCRAELVQGNYFHAVLEASKSVSAKIRDLTGIEDDGVSLVDRAFTTKHGDPPLAFNSLRTSSQRSAHAGYAHFARGVAGAFRNPTAHEPKVEFEMSEEDAIDMLATISMMHRRLDDASITPSAPKWTSSLSPQPGASDPRGAEPPAR